MERTTIYLDPLLKRQLKEAAARRGTTEAFVLREALTQYFANTDRPKVRPIGKSRDGGVAHRVDEALEDLGFGRS